MGLQENMAEYIRKVMSREKKSFSEFSEELGISRNSLYGYSTGAGNPTLATLDQIARKMDVSPAVILGLSALDQKEALQLILSAIQDVKELTEEKRLRFAELFLEMVELWDGE